MKFAHLKRYLIDVNVFSQDFIIKNSLKRNKSINRKYEDQQQDYFRYQLKKYTEMKEELDSRINKQDSYFEDVQYLASQDKRPTKATKAFKKRENKQNKVISLSKELTMKIKELEYEMMGSWLQFNNHIEENIQYIQYQHNRSQPFQLIRTSGQEQIYEQIKEFKKDQFRQGSYMDKFILDQEYDIDNILLNGKEGQFVYNNETLFSFAKSFSDSKEQRAYLLDQLLNIFKLRELTIFNCPPQNLKPFEASRFEIVGEDKGQLRRFASISNTLQYLGERYLYDEKLYMLLCKID
ncbi:hypothetical protein pb186bvf_004253 [Paramecium bursaria]